VQLLQQQKSNTLNIYLKNSFKLNEFFIFARNKLPLKKQLFKIIAKINKAVLPSFSKRRLDLSKANKVQLIILAWRIYATKRALD